VPDGACWFVVFVRDGPADEPLAALRAGDTLADADYWDTDDALVAIVEYRLALEFAAACAPSEPPLIH